MQNSAHNIWESFRQGVNHHPHQIACHFKEEAVFKHFSYEELYQRTLQFAFVLKESGVQAREHVAILAENHPDFVIAFFAVMALDATLVPLDIQYTDEQIQAILKHSEAKTLLASTRTLKQKPDLQAQRLLVIDGQEAVDIHEDKIEEWPQAKPGEYAVIFYTSGTTGEPKGVCLTHHNLLSNVQALKKLGLIHSKDVTLSFLPLHHAYAFTGTVLFPLLSGSQVALCPSVASVDLITTMKEVGVTIFVGVPQVFHLMVQGIHKRLKQLPAGARIAISLVSPLARAVRPLCGPVLQKLLFKRIHATFGGRIRFLVSGGARLEPNVAEDFTNWGFTVLEGYGLTETSPVSAFNTPKKQALGSVGVPLPGVDIMIHDPNEEGVGEVWIKGDHVMKGYYKDDAATREVITGEGWFRSGDLGYIANNGQLYLNGRMKEVIVLENGKNIQPEEIEQHYEKIPLIKEVGVFLRKGDIQTMGVDELMALIYLDEEKVKSFQQLNLFETIKWELDNYSAQLPSYKRLKGFVLVKEPLPRTRLGKLKRFSLAGIYASHQSQEKASVQENLPEQASVGNLEEAARNFIETELKRKVKPEDHLELDLGLDSLNRIELLLNLQEGLGLEMTEDQAMDFFGCQTIGDLQGKLNEHYATTPVETSRREEGFNWQDLLKEDPGEEERSQIKLHFGFLALTFNFIVILIFKILFKCLFFLTAKGREHLPDKGPYILAPNHTSFLDGLFVMCALPFKVIVQTYFIGMGQFLNAPLLKPFGKIARLIAIEFNFQLLETLKICAYLMREGKVVCYFPEGQRSIDGEVKEFKKGIGVLLKELNIPIIPVYLKGAYKTWNRHQKFPHPSPVCVVFGKPLCLNDLEVDSQTGADPYTELAEQLRRRVIHLTK